jgi:hypothetical protein
MPVITGRKVYLKLNGVPISTYCDSVNKSNNQEEQDGTNFQPDVTNPKKNILYGFEDKRLAVTGKWSQEGEEALNPLMGLTDVEWVYGPQGHATGQVRYHGQGNTGKYTGAISNVAGVTTHSFEIAITSEETDVFDGGSPV